MAKKKAPRRKKKAHPSKRPPARAGRARARGRGRKATTSRLHRAKATRKRVAPVRGRVLNVERSLLRRGDPLRKASYAKGQSFPMTAELKRGNSTPAGAVASCREARDHLRMSQDDFARLLGRNHATIENWETPNKKRRVDTPPYFLQLFGAFMHAQSPSGYELRRIIKVEGPVRALFWLLRSAFEGPQLRAVGAE